MRDNKLDKKKKKVLFALAVILLCSSISADSKNKCEINPFVRNAPLLINPSDSTIIYPHRQNGNWIVKFEPGQPVEFACPQRRVVINGISNNYVVKAVCKSNTLFSINGQDYDWNQISCSDCPVLETKRTNVPCASNAELIEVGIGLGHGRFVRAMNICFNTSSQIPLYSYCVIPSIIDPQFIQKNRNEFYQDIHFYDIGSVDELYRRRKQRQTINNLLGHSPTSTEIIQEGDLYFLSRGHLSAKADFVYGPFQDATCRYINAAPQWQCFNGYNWNQAEISTRNYASRNHVDLHVWTGTYGLTTLPHARTGENTALSLYASNNKQALIVPAIFWKVVYEPNSKKGVVIIGINNPYDSNFHKYIICSDISSRIDWLILEWNDIRRGYLYVCTVDSFRRMVRHAPAIIVNDVLT